VIDMDHMFNNAISFNQSIGHWDTGAVTSMAHMFNFAEVFNQDISTWTTDSVVDMSGMLRFAEAFDQDISAWNISSLTDATNMFDSSGMSLANYDALLSGWSDLQTTDGETAIQNDVTLGAENVDYTDATSRQHLMDHYNWAVGGDLVVGTIVGQNDTGDTLGDANAASALIIHGLGGDDQITGSAFADVLVGGDGNDTLTGGAGADRFEVKFRDEGNDLILDFSTAEGDQLNISQLLDRDDAVDLSNFVTATDDNGDAVITIDHDGAGGFADIVTVTLAGVGGGSDAGFIDDLVAGSSLIIA
jgi:Ca2+-binding RTX toxin-like protein